jgi:hypothetical protein
MRGYTVKKSLLRAPNGSKTFKIYIHYFLKMYIIIAQFKFEF